MSHWSPCYEFRVGNNESVLTSYLEENKSSDNSSSLFDCHFIWDHCVLYFYFFSWIVRKPLFLLLLLFGQSSYVRTYIHISSHLGNFTFQRIIHSLKSNNTNNNNYANAVRMNNSYLCFTELGRVPPKMLQGTKRRRFLL